MLMSWLDCIFILEKYGTRFVILMDSSLKWTISDLHVYALKKYKLTVYKCSIGDSAFLCGGNTN